MSVGELPQNHLDDLNTTINLLKYSRDFLIAQLLLNLESTLPDINDAINSSKGTVKSILGRLWYTVDEAILDDVIYGLTGLRSGMDSEQAKDFLNNKVDRRQYKILKAIRDNAIRGGGIPHDFL